MTMKHIDSLLVFAAVAATLSSCSVFNKGSRTEQPAQPTSVTDNRTAARPDAKAENVITNDMLEGEWTIVRVNGQQLPQEDQMPYVTFEPATGAIYAYNGCNTINGSFKLKGSALELSNVAITMMMCQNVPFENEITALLSGAGVPQVSLSAQGHESYLTIADKARSLSLTARRHNMEFLNGQWRIAQINGKTINDDEANIFIDLGEMKVHGNTGCNYFNGEIYIDPSKSNSVEFGKMGLTRMACPKFEQEQAMMLALEETTSAVRTDNGRVRLLKADGTPVILLERQQVE